MLDTPDETAVEPTLAAMNAAAEAARTANHTAYCAPSDPGALYARAGALHDLLVKVEQLTQMLGVAALDADADGMLADDGASPAEHLGEAAGSLMAARDAIAQAHRRVDSAWQRLSHLGTR